MAQIRVEAAILVPDKPDGLDIPDVAWEQIMKQVWIRWWKYYYHQFQEEIDASLTEFTNKVFEAVGKAAGIDAVPAADGDGVSILSAQGDTTSTQVGPSLIADRNPSA
jgi:hypothetical protein